MSEGQGWDNHFFVAYHLTHCVSFVIMCTYQVPLSPPLENKISLSLLVSRILIVRQFSCTGVTAATYSGWYGYVGTYFTNYSK